MTEQCYSDDAVDRDITIIQQRHACIDNREQDHTAGIGFVNIAQDFPSLAEPVSTGNRLKFKLEFMFMLLGAGRNDEAAEAYNQLIAEFDKLA